MGKERQRGNLTPKGETRLWLIVVAGDVRSIISICLTSKLTDGERESLSVRLKGGRREKLVGRESLGD